MSNGNHSCNTYLQNKILYTVRIDFFVNERDPGLFILLVAVSFKPGRQLDFVLKDEKL